MARLFLVACITLTIMAALVQAATEKTYECYTCSSEINLGGVEVQTSGTDVGEPVEKSCISGADDATSGSTEYKRCKVTYDTLELESEGKVTFSRGGDNEEMEGEEPYCDSEGCYCVGDKCNTLKYEVPKTFNCYMCDTVGFFDNGCADEGEEFKAGGTYMRTATGCSACGKTMTKNPDYSYSMSRGCARSVHVEEGCYEEDNVEYCVCMEDKCNSAPGFRVSFTFGAFLAVLSAAKALFL